MNNYKNELNFHDRKKRLAEMLRKFHIFCCDNGYRYYVFAGTLIGTVRHSGFIPWDDDIDVVMPREDYERFIKCNSIGEDLEIISHGNSQGHYHPFAYCNVADKTTIMRESFIQHSTNKGLFLDVFPLDGLPEKYDNALSYSRKLSIYGKVLMYNVAPTVKITSARNFLKDIVIRLAHLKNTDRLVNKIDGLAKRYSFSGSKLCTVHTPIVYPRRKMIFQTDDFNSVVLMKFEDFYVNTPVGYDNILKTNYGDYMQLPPVEQREPHHGVDVYWK